MSEQKMNDIIKQESATDYVYRTLPQMQGETDFRYKQRVFKRVEQLKKIHAFKQANVIGTVNCKEVKK